MPTFYDLMKYAATGIASADMTAFDKARALSLFGGGKTQALTDVPPLSFRANGKPLISWSMLGNGQQNGTPSPDNIIMPTFCGKLVGADWTIPITCAGQTTPVYLGQTQTVRKIRKLVLDGTEDFINNSNNACCVLFINPIGLFREYNPLIVCTHMKRAETQNQLYNRYTDYGITFGGSAADRICIRNKDCEPVTDLKAWLASEYAAGTPVTVWYVLATEQTGIVNEPLSKIGNYADELSSEDAAVTIPTVKGQNTLTVEGELQPSSMTITYKS